MRYHINKNNEPAPCHAKSPASCPCRGNGDVDENGDLIGNGHYDSLEEATRAVEHKLEMKNRGYVRRIKKRMARISPEEETADRSNEGMNPGPWASSTTRMIDVLDSNGPVPVTDLAEMSRLAVSDEDRDKIRAVLESNGIIDGVATTFEPDGPGYYDRSEFKNISYNGAEAGYGSAARYVETTPIDYETPEQEWNIRLSDSVRSRRWSKDEFNELTKIGAIRGEYGYITYGHQDFAENAYSADSAFVWRINDDGETATGVWTRIDTSECVELTDPVPLSDLSSARINDETRQGLKQTMKASRRMGDSIDKAMRSSEEYRRNLKSSGDYNVIGQHVINGDKVEVTRSDGSKAVGTITIYSYGPYVEFDDPGLDFELYVDSDGHITTDVDSVSRSEDKYLIPREHRSSNGEILSFDRLTLMSSNGTDALTEIDRRKKTAASINDSLRSRQSGLRNKAVYLHQLGLEDEEKQHRAEYDKKNVLYRMFRPYVPKWTAESIKAETASFERAYRDRDRSGHVK